MCLPVDALLNYYFAQVGLLPEAVLSVVSIVTIIVSVGCVRSLPPFGSLSDIIAYSSL